jgi:DNA-binding CsgD family transcriptional regulator
MSIDQSMLSALDGIYAAATDEARWPEVIQTLLELTGSQAASFCVLDGSNKRMPIFSYINNERRDVETARFISEYLEGGMAQYDPTVQYIVTHPCQTLFLDSSFISDGDKDRLAYYDWQRGFSDQRYRMAGMIGAGPNVQSGITLHRTRQAGDFTSSDIERFKFLIPHLERAVRIGFQLGTLTELHSISLTMLEASTRAIVLLDCKGRVTFANSAAVSIAAMKDGVVFSRAGLFLENESDNRRLQELIASALVIPERQLDKASGAMRAWRRSGRRAFSILVSSLSPTNTLATTDRSAVCIVILDPERRNPVPEDLLRDLFGLTRSEARLAARLAQGETLQAAAAELHLNYSTVRTQLIAIFRKTNTNRQGELVQLLLGSIPSP